MTEAGRDEDQASTRPGWARQASTAMFAPNEQPTSVAVGTPDRVHHPDDVVVIGERTWHHRGAAEAAEIEADDAEPIGERGKFRVPHPRIGDAGVNENEAGA